MVGTECSKLRKKMLMLGVHMYATTRFHNIITNNLNACSCEALMMFYSHNTQSKHKIPPLAQYRYYTGFSVV
jgi:hypothetical protein